MSMKTNEQDEPKTVHAHHGMLFISCGRLSKNGSHGLIFDYLVPRWWNCLGRVRRGNFIGGGMSLGGGI